jgi:hypothetical protein
MIGILHFLTLVITTMLAAAAAVLVNWLLLRATFQLMRPATADRTSSNSSGAKTARRPLVAGAGTVQVARAYAGRR